MSKSRRAARSSRKARAEELFIRADQQDDNRNFRSAFRLFLAGAKLGEKGCQVNVGNYYDDAKGIRRNRKAALYWYKRAYRGGIATAANNIGVLWRNDKYPKRALAWFKKAARMGNDDANLEIAKYFLQTDPNPYKAILHLKIVCESEWVSEANVEEAEKLLKRAKKMQNAFS
jgi:TPR repeat protein